MSSVSGDSLEPSGLMSPSSTVRCLTKDLQHSLDLASATSGDKVVTAQVSESVEQDFFFFLNKIRYISLMRYCVLFFY